MVQEILDEREERIRCYGICHELHGLFGVIAILWFCMITVHRNKGHAWRWVTCIYSIAISYQRQQQEKDMAENRETKDSMVDFYRMTVSCLFCLCPCCVLS